MNKPQTPSSASSSRDQTSTARDVIRPVVGRNDLNLAESDFSDLPAGAPVSGTDHGLERQRFEEVVAVGEPEFVHEIASPILSYYELRDGHVHLEGCTLEARPVLRIRGAVDREDASFLYFGPSGQRLSDEEVARFGFRETATIDARLRESDQRSLEEWISVATRQDAAQRVSPRKESSVDWENLQPTVIWRTWAAGKVRLKFQSGASTSIEFQGWAREFQAGTQKPPKLSCLVSGLDSYRCVCLSDGRITVAEAIAPCQVSGREMLAAERVLCEVTGRWVDPDMVETCEVTHRVAAKDAMADCRCCGSRVVPGALQYELCSRCTELPLIDIESAAGADLLGRLSDDQRRRFEGKRLRGWADSRVAVVESQGLTTRHRYVFDLRDGTLLREATRSRLSKQWRWGNDQGSSSEQR